MQVGKLGLYVCHCNSSFRQTSVPLLMQVSRVNLDNRNRAHHRSDFVVAESSITENLLPLMLLAPHAADAREEQAMHLFCLSNFCVTMRPGPQHHLCDYHLSSGVSCRDSILAMLKNLDAIVVVPAMQNILTHKTY